MNFENINRDNYEIYIVDYYDGTLSDVLKVELFAFLEANPDLKQEFEDFRIMPLVPESMEYSFKQSLKKDNNAIPPLTEQKINELLVARLEGDITAEENLQLTAYIKQHPEVEKDEILYQKTVLQADKNIVFPHKENLKREGKIIPFYYWSVAASVALLILFYWIFVPQNFTPDNSVATNTIQEPENKNSLTEIISDTNNKVTAPTIEEEINEKDLSVRLADNKKTEKKSSVKRNVKKDFSNKNKEDKKEILEPSQHITTQELLTQANETTPETTKDDNFDNPIVIKADAVPVAMQTNEKEFLNIDELIAARIREKELAKTEGTPSKKIEKGDMISLGGKIWKKLTGRNVNMKKQYDENGELYAYYIKTGSFEISKKGNK